MKLNTSAAPVEVVGNTSNSNFSIAVNGKAFRVLSDTLYKNKIGSIVREVSCNAYDAHVMAGKKDVPFVVHLPDDFEPWFSVQDQGVGLSPEDIATVFTVYFQSTKDQSNDAIGAFGLGAKTPFSYTDQFTVTSVKDGMKRMYSAYITPEGIPNIAEMHVEETTEGNGVEIRIAVKREDYYKFKTEVINQLKYFKVKPLVENVSVEWGNPEASIFQVDGCEVFTRQFRDSGNFIILQGNVGYDLDWNAVRANISEEARVFADRLTSYKTILEFDIGQIGVTASREGVEYDKTTLKNINDRLVAVQEKCTKFVAEKIKDFDTEYEKAVFIHSNEVYFRLSDYKYKDGFSLRGYGANASISLPADIGITAFQKSNGKLRKIYSANAIMYLNSISKTPIVIKDAETIGRMNQRISETTDYGTAFLIIPRQDQKITDIVDSLIKAQGGYSGNIKMASQITLPKIQRATHTPSTFYVIGHSDNSLRNWKKVTDQTIEDIEQETVYTDSFGMDFEDPKSIAEYRALKTIEDSIPVLISIKKSDTEKAEKNEHMIPLVDFIAEKRKEYESKLDSGLKRKFICYGFVSDVKEYIPHRMQQFSRELLQYAPNAELTKILNMTGTPDPKALTNSEINLCKFMGLESERWDFREKRRTRIAKVAEKLKNKYPLLEPVFDNYRYDSKQVALAQYVNLVYNSSVS